MSSTTTTARPYRNVLLTPDVMAKLAVADPDGLLTEALCRRNHTTTKAMIAIAQAEARKMIAAQTVIAAPAPTPEPAKKERTRKYPLTGSGRNVSDVANELAREAYKAGVSVKYAQARDFVLENLADF